MTKPEIAQAETRGVGRPRSLTIEQVLDAANEIGLAEVSMKRLSTQLGVGIATLYRYVENRDELIRLASARSAHREAPTDTGQPWPEIMLGYAESLYSSLGGNPQLIVTHMEGGLGTEVEVEFLDSFLNALMRRGFAAEQALELFHAMGWIVMGAAVARAYVTSLHSAGKTLERSLRQALAQREPQELPAIRASAALYGKENARSDWRAALTHLIRSVALARGEAIPPLPVEQR
jgi:AcrR family transcriptional regulator